MRRKLLGAAVCAALSAAFLGTGLSPALADDAGAESAKTLTYKEIVVGVGSDASKETFSDEFATYGLGYGKVTEDPSTVKKYETVTPSASNSFLFVDAAQTVSTDDWQIYTKKNAAVMYITAKKGVKLTAADNGLAGWTADATFSYYLRSDNALQTLFTKVGVTAADVGIEVYMDAGDTFYMEYVFEWDQRNLQSPPSFTLDAGAYEAKAAKEKSLADLDAAFAGYAQADYSPANWEKLSGICEAAKTAVNAAATAEEATAAAAKALADMDAVLTLAEEAGALAAAKTQAIEELDAALAGYAEADYSAEGWASLGEICQTAKTAVNGGETPEAVKEIAVKAKADLAAVKTLAAEGIEAVEKALAGYSRADYSAANWTLLQEIVDKAKTDIAAAPGAEAAAIAERAIADLDAVKTLAEEGADALAIAKAAAIAEVNAALDGYTQGDYSAANWTQMTGIVGKAETDINAAATEAALAPIVAKAKGDLQAVDTLKDEAAAELEAELANYEEAKYSAANWEALTEIVAKAKEDLLGAATNEISDIVTKAKTDMAAVTTLEEEAALELATYKESKIKELKDYAKSLDEIDYTEENWKKIGKIASDFETAVAELDTKEKVTEAFAAAKAEIDKVEVYSPVSDSFDMDSMVKYAVAKKLGGLVDYGNVKVQMLGGTVDAPVEYDNFGFSVGADGSKQYMLSKAGMDAFDKCDSAFAPWRLKYNSASWAIIKIVADVDTKLVVSHAAFNGGWVQGGAFVAGYVKGLNRANQTQTVRFYYEYLNSTAGEAGQFGCTVQLKAGDEYYFVVGNEYMTGVNVEGNLNIIPSFEVKTGEYSADERNQVFDAANALENAKAEALEELNAEFAKYAKEKYSIERWAEIEFIRDEAEAAIKAAEAETVLKGIVEKAAKDMAATLNLEGEAAALAKHKSEKLQELKDYADSLGKKNYSKDNWNKIEKIITDFETAIGSINDVNKVSREFNKAKGEIDAVEAKKGCGSSLSAPALCAGLLLLGAAVVGLSVKKRKI